MTTPRGVEPSWETTGSPHACGAGFAPTEANSDETFEEEPGNLRSLARNLLAWTIWPLLMSVSFGIAYALISNGSSPVATPFALFVPLALIVAFLEQHLPHEPEWNLNDGQIPNDLFHGTVGTVLTGKLAESVVFAACGAIAVLLADLHVRQPWPAHWPLPAQFVLVLLIGELGSYWGHRLAHEVPVLWRFHALHHSSKRLYWFNGTRFHPVDSVRRASLAVPLPLLLGAPTEVIALLVSFFLYNGVLSHSNIDIRCGPLDWIFNTPNVHRWHHSRNPDEGNNNYADNLMIWDLVFSSFYRPVGRPHSAVGTTTPVPDSIGPQLLEPFRSGRKGDRAFGSISES